MWGTDAVSTGILNYFSSPKKGATVPNMQQHLFILFLLLSFSAAFGQALPNRPNTITYFTVSPDQVETVLYRNVLTYDKKGSLTTSRTEAPVGNDLFTSYLVTTYTYDALDSLSGFMSVGSGNPTGTAFRSRFVFTRDERGNKLIDESSLWDFAQKAWRKSARTSQTFDEQNRVTSRRFAHYNQVSQSWVSISTLTYAYPDRQQILQWPNQRITTFYDERNRLIKTTTEAMQQGKFSLIDYTTTEYTATTQTSKQYHRPNFEQPYLTTVTHLNTQGKPERVDYQLDQSIYRLSDSPVNSSISRSYNLYSYDAAGRLLEQVNWEYPTGQLVARRTSGVRYTYDSPLVSQPILMLFPNPTIGPVNLLNAGFHGCVERYEVVNQDGQTVQQATAQVNIKIAENPECAPKIDLAALPDGVYVMRLFMGDSTVVSERVVLKKNR